MSEGVKYLSTSPQLSFKVASCCIHVIVVFPSSIHLRRSKKRWRERAPYDFTVEAVSRKYTVSSVPSEFEIKILKLGPYVKRGNSQNGEKIWRENGHVAKVAGTKLNDEDHDIRSTALPYAFRYPDVVHQ